MCRLCQILNILPWTLNLLQRCLTMGLMCYTTLVVTIGLLMAIVTGLAYGYNYSMAEFIAIGKENNMTFYLKGGRLIARKTVPTTTPTTTTPTTTLTTTTIIGRRFFGVNDFEPRPSADTWESKVEIAISSRNETDDDFKKHPKRTTMHGDLYLDSDEQLEDNLFRKGLITNSDLSTTQTVNKETSDRIGNALIKWQVDNSVDLETEEIRTDKEKLPGNGVEKVLSKILMKFQMDKETTPWPSVTVATISQE